MPLKTCVKIYYFSGTGNSLAVARDLAVRLEGELSAIPEVLRDKGGGSASAEGGTDAAGREIRPEADTLVIVFPVYYETFGGVPLIVRRFVSRLTGIESAYIAGVCTYGSGGFAAMELLGKLLERRGGKLSATMSVNMPENIYPELALAKQPRMYKCWRDHAEGAAEFIRRQETGRYRLPNLLAGPAYGLFRLIAPLLLKLFEKSSLKKLQEQSGAAVEDYEKLIPLMDNSFSVSDACTGCGTCVKVCPVENIEMREGPVWLHRCEFCLACLHCCPAGSISSTAVKGERRYHHPDVELREMILRK